MLEISKLLDLIKQFHTNLNATRSGCLFVFFFLQDAVFDKKTGQITFKKQSLIQKLFQATQGQKVGKCTENNSVTR